MPCSSNTIQIDGHDARVSSVVRFTLGPGPHHHQDMQDGSSVAAAPPHVNIDLAASHHHPGHRGRHHHDERVIERQWVTSGTAAGKSSALVTRSVSNSTDISQQSVEVDGHIDDDEGEVTLGEDGDGDDDDYIGNSYGEFDDELSKRQCDYISTRLHACLRDGKHRYLGRACELLLPDRLTLRAAQDVMRLSENEPCGIRGCHLIINYENTRLGTLNIDPDTVPTFELVLTFHKDDSKHWWHLVGALPFPYCISAAATGSAIILSAGFTLVKHRLYRT